jgi:hypothetical protein
MEEEEGSVCWSVVGDEDDGEEERSASERGGRLRYCPPAGEVDEVALLGCCRPLPVNPCCISRRRSYSSCCRRS